MAEIIKASTPYKCPKCGSEEIYRDAANNIYECIDCGCKWRLETTAELLKKYGVPEEEWPEEYRPKK